MHPYGLRCLQLPVAHLRYEVLAITYGSRPRSQSVRARLVVVRGQTQNTIYSGLQS